MEPGMTIFIIAFALGFILLSVLAVLSFHFPLLGHYTRAAYFGTLHILASPFVLLGKVFGLLRKGLSAIFQPLSDTRTYMRQQKALRPVSSKGNGWEMDEDDLLERRIMPQYSYLPTNIHHKSIHDD